MKIIQQDMLSDLPSDQDWNPVSTVCANQIISFSFMSRQGDLA